jgi:diaminopimelate decarboxylase
VKELNLAENMKINETGHLEIGGIDVISLIKEYGSPLYILDEQVFRKNCRKFRDAFAEIGDSLVIYASKTLSCLAACTMVKEEGLGLDVVSGGELYTALQVGFPPEKIYFHGNNKTKDELRFAVSSNIGRIVVDNLWELNILNQVCQELNITQDNCCCNRYYKHLITPGCFHFSFFADSNMHLPPLDGIVFLSYFLIHLLLVQVLMPFCMACPLS